MARMGSVGAGEGGFNREIWRTSLGQPLINVWSRLMESNGDILGNAGKSKKKKDSGEEKEGGGGKEENPVDIFVVQELDFGVADNRVHDFKRAQLMQNDGAQNIELLEGAFGVARSRRRSSRRSRTEPRLRSSTS